MPKTDRPLTIGMSRVYFGPMYFGEEIEALSRKGLLRSLSRVESASSSRIVVEGRTYLNLSSNNYLGLSTHPKVKEAAAQAIQQYGVGTGASALISGHTQLHQKLAERVAQFKHAEAALIFSTGYMANVGTLSALLGDGDLIYADRLSHASIIDGCHMSKATLRVFPHRDTQSLARHLGRVATGQRVLIVTDGVFSMDGDLALLPEIVKLAEQHGATVMVDDAHATGVLGPTGRGTLEHFGLEGQVAIQMGTLSKAVGAFGAYVAGSQDLITYLLNRAKSYIYTTALPTSLAAASLAALEIIEKEPQIRQQLWDNRAYYEQGVKSMGYNTLQTETPI
ncbi:MAG: 8-amino-7-oxononanoate synthase, partial [Nitrospira sp.]|nr:8-amino-7-oxononanoate synthase [Nitrospira sp.]